MKKNIGSVCEVYARAQVRGCESRAGDGETEPGNRGVTTSGQSVVTP